MPYNLQSQGAGNIDLQRETEKPHPYNAENLFRALSGEELQNVHHEWPLLVQQHSLASSEKTRQRADACQDLASLNTKQEVFGRHFDGM